MTREKSPKLIRWANKRSFSKIKCYCTPNTPARGIDSVSSGSSDNGASQPLPQGWFWLHIRYNRISVSINTSSQQTKTFRTKFSFLSFPNVSPSSILRYPLLLLKLGHAGRASFSLRNLKQDALQTLEPLPLYRLRKKFFLNESKSLQSYLRLALRPEKIKLFLYFCKKTWIHRKKNNIL